MKGAGLLSVVSVEGLLDFLRSVPSSHTMREGEASASAGGCEDALMVELWADAHPEVFFCLFIDLCCNLFPFFVLRRQRNAKLNSFKVFQTFITLSLNEFMPPINID